MGAFAYSTPSIGRTRWRLIPQRSPLHRLVSAHYPTLADRMAREDRPLPEYVCREFDAYLRCGCLEHGFLRVRSKRCRAERLVAFSCKRRDFGFSTP